MNKIASTFIFFLFINTFLYAQKEKNYKLKSPDGNLIVNIQTGAKLLWSIQSSGQQIIAPSAISLQLQGGQALGDNAKIVSSSAQKINKIFAALHYKKDSVQDNCNQLTLQCKGDYGIIFRAYNDGVAYRFFTKKKGQIIIQSEEANFNFQNDDSAYIPYVNDPYPDIYSLSFESLYQHIKLSEFKKDTLAFLPVLVDVGNGKKAAILEADLEDYPGMFVQHNASTTGLSGKFAPYVLEEKTGGHNSLQSLVTKRADYIASTDGTRSFPWRIVVISNSDKELLNNDMVYKLASPSRVTDVSWIRPGKVAWDWWNDWNISHVDFRAGINTATYLYYIDFAAAHNIEFILLDEGWAPPDDIMKVVSEVDLQKIIDYGKQKNVGVWLWGGALPIDNKMEEALTRYSQMGIRGFKIDFMNRDDEKMVQFYYRV